MNNSKIKLNQIPSILMKSGMALSFLLLFLSLVFYIGAGRFGNYYEFNIISRELIVCARQCFGVISMGAFGMYFVLK